MVRPHADMFVAKHPCCHRGNMLCHLAVGILLIYVDLQWRGTENNKELAMIGQSKVTFILAYT